ncbi:hypothetical protein [Amycolatopsis albispora]|uniref:hypothetical protein n=1 Tax=Amycolatopsis albispora TaxID=1804986 RepID=UPI0013B433A5|nr:hypothetical protein [Amycolatopsis albispora]
MDPVNPPPGRRAQNRAARPAFDEARLAGLARRRLRKLQYLSRHSQTVVHLPPAETPDPPVETPDRSPAA